MKQIITIFLLLTIGITANAQEWKEFLPKNKTEHELTLFDYQKAFREYEKSYQSIDGFYFENSEKRKLPDYKHFKRWEFDMEHRVNQRTGILPEKTDWDRIQEHKKQHPDLYRSSGGAWSGISPMDYTNWFNNSGLGRVTAIGFHPTDTNTFFVGAASGGLWKTVDGGQTYTSLTDTLGYEAILKIHVPDDYPTSNTFYILAAQYYSYNDGVDYGKIFKTTDGGLSWTMLNLGYNYPVPSTDPHSEGGIDKDYWLKFDNDDPNVFYAKLTYGATVYQQYNGWYKTINGGDTWAALNHDIGRVFHPVNDDIQYYINPNGHFMKTTDGGNTWVQKYDLGYTIPFQDYYHIAVSDDQPDYVYFVTGFYPNMDGFYKSTDAGETFTQVLNNTTGPNLYGTCTGGFNDNIHPSGNGELAVNPNNADDIFVGYFITWHSTDGGYNWYRRACNDQTETKQAHPDKHFYGFQPITNAMYEGNDGGITKSYDGVYWTNLSQNLPISQIYRIGISQNAQSEYLFGTQDNGTFYHSSSANTWSMVLGGDGMDCAIDPNNDNIQICSGQNGGFFRTTDKWVTKSYLYQNFPSGFVGHWVTPLDLHPTNPNIFYILGDNMLIKTADAGNSFTQIGSGANCFSVSPSNPDIIYKADKIYVNRTTQNTLLKTTDGGNTWVDIISNFNLSYDPEIKYIEFDDNDSDTVWVVTTSSTQNNMYYGGVFKTTDGGQTWTDISSGLPDNRFNVIAYNKQYTAGSEIYLGTYGGGSYVKREGEDWIPFMTGLTSSPVMDMEIYYDTINPDNSKIRAGTYGRGLWESDLYTVMTPEAAFTATPLTGIAPLTVSFTDTSTNIPTSWSWDFGDGGTSTEQNPNYTYNVHGTYTVTLTATNSGGSDTETKTDYITVIQPVPVADFIGVPTSGDSPLSVNFTDQSTNDPTAWSWDFGDGGTSTEQNPEYTYNTHGTYTVSLIATNSGGSDTLIKTDYIIVTQPIPVADFLGTPTSGDSPLTVDFSDLSTNDPTTWVWDYGDGGTSTDQNPTYTYDTHGTYTVSLTVTNTGGSDTETKTDYIIVTQPVPVTDFSGTPMSGDSPLTVSFTDQSTNDPTSWDWDFGDGGTSGLQNPDYTYFAAGTYTVILTATNSGGSDTETKTDYITVTQPPPLADFIGTPTSGDAPLSVSFTDQSSNDPTSWDWDFGDGGTSTEQNPNYTYNSAGVYTVTMTATNPSGSDTKIRTDYISAGVPPEPPIAEFSGTPASGNAPLIVSFVDASSGSIDTWNWDFGDGGTSVLQNPDYTYTSPGTYTVSLTVTGPGGDDNEIKTDYINVTYSAPIADFNGTPTSGEFPLQVDFTDISVGEVESWDWDFGDENTSTLQNPVHIFENSGNYTVSLKATGPGGYDSIAKVNYIDVIVNIENLYSDDLSIYPNPCRDNLTIRSKESVSSIVIMDNMGNIVRNEDVQCKTPCKQEINMRQLATGNYFLKINMENGHIVMMKILKK